MSNYYSEHSEEYIENTKDADMSELYLFFEENLSKGAKRILDLGFGSGRDSLYFKNKGYDVCSIDPTPEFCENAKNLGLEDVHCMSAQEMKFNNEFDGIWACASLLHISSKELLFVFKKCYHALKNNGVMYCSFKYGEFEGERNGRHFLDLNEKTLKEYLRYANFDKIIMRETKDVRPGRNEKWLNAILFKKIPVPIKAAKL